MTIFCFGSCAFILAVNYADPKGYFLDPLNSFYFGYGICSFERLILSRIPNVHHRTIFRIAIVLTGLLIITPNQLSAFIMQAVHTVSSQYFDSQTEDRDKHLFRSYFNSKNQLSKFKDLVVKDIPESIVVITQDLQQCLFLNNSFSEVFATHTTSDVWARLDQFELEENPHDSTVAQEKEIERFKDSKLFKKFMEKAVRKWSRGETQEKFSCNLSYTRPHLSPDDSNHIATFEAGVIPIIWDEQSAIAIILHDITQQQTILSLKVADAQKDALLATVSHELRTPLNGMLGIIQVMQKRIRDKELLHYVNICKNSGNLLLALVNSILDLNQIRANTIKLYSAKVHLEEFLNELIHLFEIQCAQKNLSLKLKISQHLEKFIFTDKNRLSQILINLVGNALKFTDKGGIEILVCVPINNPDYIEFSVIDTGIGIKDQDQEKVFRIFGRLQQRNTRVNKEGVGLGLTISDTLARLLCNNTEMAGIKLQSKYGIGSIFSFCIKKDLQETLNPSKIKESGLIKLSVGSNKWSTSFGELGEIERKVHSHSLPPIENFQVLKRKGQSSPTKSLGTILLSPEKRSQILERKKAHSVVGNPLGVSDATSQSLVDAPSIKSLNTPHILIVDDNPLNLIIAEFLVSSHGYKVKTALSGQAAIDLALAADYSNQPIQLILMDLQMPGMDGYEATRHLKKLMEEQKIPEIPIVAFTANTSEADKEACLQAGMVAHLGKPLNEPDLLAVLNVWCK